VGGRARAWGTGELVRLTEVGDKESIGIRGTRKQARDHCTGVKVGQVLERDLRPSGPTRMIEGRQPQ